MPDTRPTIGWRWMRKAGAGRQCLLRPSAARRLKTVLRRNSITDTLRIYGCTPRSWIGEPALNGSRYAKAEGAVHIPKTRSCKPGFVRAVVIRQRPFGCDEFVFSLPIEYSRSSCERQTHLSMTNIIRYQKWRYSRRALRNPCSWHEIRPTTGSPGKGRNVEVRQGQLSLGRDAPLVVYGSQLAMDVHSITIDSSQFEVQHHKLPDRLQFKFYRHSRAPIVGLLHVPRVSRLS